MPNLEQVTLVSMSRSSSYIREWRLNAVNVFSRSFNFLLFQSRKLNSIVMLKHSLSSYLDTESSGSFSFQSSVPSSPGLSIDDNRPRTPLTTENLKYHAMYAAQGSGSKDLIQRFQASLDREQMVSPTPSVLKRSKRSRSSSSKDIFIESPQHSLFPYHNDSFILPAASCSSNSIKSHWASSIAAESTSRIKSSRTRISVPAVERLTAKTTSKNPTLHSGKRHLKKQVSAMTLPNEADLKLLYVEARPTKLSLTTSKLLQWLTPSVASKNWKDLRRRTTQTWHIRMDE